MKYIKEHNCYGVSRYKQLPVPQASERSVVSGGGGEGLEEGLGLITEASTLSPPHGRSSRARDNWRRREGKIWLNGFETETLDGITEALQNCWEDFLTVKLWTDCPQSHTKYFQIETSLINRRQRGILLTFEQNIIIISMNFLLFGEFVSVLIFKD